MPCNSTRKHAVTPDTQGRRHDHVRASDFEVDLHFFTSPFPPAPPRKVSAALHSRQQALVSVRCGMGDLQALELEDVLRKVPEMGWALWRSRKERAVVPGNSHLYFDGRGWEREEGRREGHSTMNRPRFKALGHIGGSVEGVCEFLITINASDALSKYLNKVHSATQCPQVSFITLLICKFL